MGARRGARARARAPPAGRPRSRVRRARGPLPAERRGRDLPRRVRPRPRPHVENPPGEMSYLLIHGGGSTGRFWDRLAPYLDSRSLAVDMPGRNGKPADLATLTVDEEVASIIADVDAG